MDWSLDDIVAAAVTSDAGAPAPGGGQQANNDLDMNFLFGNGAAGGAAAGAAQHHQPSPPAAVSTAPQQQQQQQQQFGAAALAVAANAVQTAAQANSQQMSLQQHQQQQHTPAHAHLLLNQSGAQAPNERNVKNQPIYMDFYPTVVANPTLKSTIDMTVNFLQNSARASEKSLDAEEEIFRHANGSKEGMGFLKPEGAGHEYYCAKIGRLDGLGKVPREYSAIQKLVLFKHPEPPNATANSLSVPAMRQQFQGIVGMLENAASQDTIKAGRNWVENSMRVLKNNARQVSDYIYYMIQNGGSKTFAQKCHILYVIHDVLQCEAVQSKVPKGEWRYIPVLRPYLCWMVRSGFTAAKTPQEKLKVLNLLQLWVDRGVLTEVEKEEMRIIAEATPDQIPSTADDGKVEREWAQALNPQPAVFPQPAPAGQQQWQGTDWDNWLGQQFGANPNAPAAGAPGSGGAAAGGWANWDMGGLFGNVGNGASSSSAPQGPEQQPSQEQLQQQLAQTQMQLQQVQMMQNLATGKAAAPAGGVVVAPAGAAPQFGGGLPPQQNMQFPPPNQQVQQQPGAAGGGAQPTFAQLNTPESVPVGLMSTMLKQMSTRNRHAQTAFVPYTPIDPELVPTNFPSFAQLTDRQKRQVRDFFSDEEEETRRRDKKERRRRRRRRGESSSESSSSDDESSVSPMGRGPPPPRPSAFANSVPFAEDAVPPPIQFQPIDGTRML